jgi:hypothetical protein
MADPLVSTLQSGMTHRPAAADEGSLNSRRYGIADLVEALRDPLSTSQRIAVGNSLYAAPTAFALRAGGHWSASGKALPSVLSTVRPALADRFTDVFERYYVTEKRPHYADWPMTSWRPTGAGSATDSSRKHRYLGAIIS